MQSGEGFGRDTQSGKAASARAHGAVNVEARSAVLETKKRHVEVVTRLPTERLATACWAFIVVKRTGLEAAPVLVFGPLHSANMENCQQDIHRLVAARNAASQQS